ncbi:MAG: PAM68 family protein [Cyanobacteria bacterium]|nr:PAM68 family protein [Cyanobacteriota bacterium]MDW8201691.1 PAM68 family protein [Cyanobacteriota bacterium SKYGB_h_bin112]
MATDQTSNSSDRQRLPFEPASGRKKGKSQAGDKQVVAEKRASAPSGTTASSGSQRSQSNSLQERAKQILGKTASPAEATDAQADRAVGIPEVVSRRMVSRMVVLCGIPSIMGILVFVISYQLVSHGWFALPNVAVLLVSMGCFGLGVVGLSYGALSASWEEDTPGSLVGISEFLVNFKRMTDAWAVARERRRAAKSSPES